MCGYLARRGLASDGGEILDPTTVGSLDLAAQSRILDVLVNVTRLAHSMTLTSGIGQESKVPSDCTVPSQFLVFKGTSRR